MEGGGAQVVIPDLDDEDELYPLPDSDNRSRRVGGSAEAATISTASPPRPSRGPFRGAELNFHNRSGSTTGSGTSEEWDNSNILSNSLNSGFGASNSNSSSNQSQFVNSSTIPNSLNYDNSGSTNLNSSTSTPTPSASSYRFPPRNPDSNPTSASASSFSFPRKASFASLKAAIKGQSNAGSLTGGKASEITQNVGGSGGYGTLGTTSYGASNIPSALYASHCGMGPSTPIGEEFSSQSGPDFGSMSSGKGGFIGAGLPTGKSSRPSSPSASKFNVTANSHGRQASYFSEHSTGAASSSAESQGQSQAGTAPPLPPFPDLFGHSANPFQQHGRHYSSSSSAANASFTHSSSFVGGGHFPHNIDPKQMRDPNSNERDRDAGWEGTQSLGSPFLAGSAFSAPSSSSKGGFGSLAAHKGRSRPAPSYDQRQHSFEAPSIDLALVQSLEDSSISDPISPSSYKEAAGLSAVKSVYDEARTPTVAGGSTRAGSSNANSQFGVETPGLGTLPRGVGAPDPSTPAEYAMNILLSRFITLAGLKIKLVMERNVQSGPVSSIQLATGQDAAFDSLLDSLAYMAKKNAKQILDSLFCWRSIVANSAVDVAMVRKSMVEIKQSESGNVSSSASVTGGGINATSSSISSTSSINLSHASVKEVAAKLTRRKRFTSLYLLSEALIRICKQLTKSSLSEAESSTLEREAFEMLKECMYNGLESPNTVGTIKEKEKEKEKASKVPSGNTDALSSASSLSKSFSSGMPAICFDIVSSLIGEISRTHFASVGDRFISALEQSSKARMAAASSASSKEREREIDASTEANIQAMKDLTITIYPLESFEEGADFVEALARFFVASHGHRIKSAYAQTLTHLLLRVAKSASAEVNHPTWTKAVETIWPRAVAMTSKPRYWSVAYPLYVSLLCVSVEEKLLTHWFPAVEMGFAKLKDRGHRNIILNGAVRLLWVYIFRCQESTNATTKRLDSFFRLWFPASRRHVTPAEGSHAAHVMMLHFVLFRHFDYGRDLILDFLRSSALSGNTLSLQPDVLSRSRMTISIRAILMTLDRYVKGEQPSIPVGADFESSDFEEAVSASGDELPSSFTYPTADIGAAQDKFNDLIGKIALICEHQVSDVNVFDERILILRGSSGAVTAGASSDKAIVEREGLIWRSHAGSNFTVAYVRDHQPYFDLLQACFQSWPRCLSNNLPFSTVLSILFRSHFSADPSVAASSSEALRRIAKQRKGGATAVVSGFMRWIFRPETVFWEVHHDQILLLPKVEQAVSLWFEFLEIWLSELREQRGGGDGSGPAMKGSEMERTSAWAIIDEVEAYGLLLLCSGWQPLRHQATLILKVVAALDETFLSQARRQALRAAQLNGEEEISRIIHLLNKPCANYCSEEDPHLSIAQQARASKWRRGSNAEALSDLAESQNAVEHSLWQHVFPHFLRMCLEYFPTTVAVFRSHVTNRVPSMDQAVAHAAGTTPRMPGGGALGTISNSNGKVSSVASLTADQVLMAEHWKLYILALCTTTTSTEGSRGAVAMGHRRQSSESGSERVIAARDLFQKLVPFLASDQSRFRDAVITALGNINSNLYRALLETMQAVCSQLNEDWRARSVGRSGQKRNRRHERLRTAIGHVILLTTPHLAKDSVLDDESTLQILLGWIRDTYNFLNDPEIKSDAGFNRLRRFLCGVMEQLFDGVVSRGEVDKYFNHDFRTRVFRTFREWHALSQAGEEGPSKFAEMLSSAAAQYRDENQRDHALGAVNRLRAEVEQLSFRAGSAMASLCQSSISDESGSLSSASARTLEAGSLFLWLENLFCNPSTQSHPIARKAMRALLLHNESHLALITKAVEHSFQEPERISSGRSFFVVLADSVLEQRTIKIPLHQAFCLALVKLGHPDREIRRKAFAMLDHVTRAQDPELILSDLETGVGSPLPAIYLRAQRDVSLYLAKAFRSIGAAMLSEYTARLPVIDRARRATTLGLVPEWIKGHNLLHVASSDAGTQIKKPSQLIDRIEPDQGGPLYSTHLILTNLFFLTIKYSDEHNFEIQDMWASLAGSEDLSLNANIIIKFLVEQALKHKSSAFVINAKRVVSCLSNTVIGPHMFNELCSLIDPGSMIPVPHEAEFTSVDAALRDLYLADLEQALPPTSRKHTFSPGQLALFFVGELTYERSEQLGSHLPILLHSIFMQIDSPSAFVQEQSVSIFEQMMRALVSGASPTPRAGNRKPNAKHEKAPESGKTRVELLFSGATTIWWTNNSTGADLDETHTPRSMRSTLSEALSILEPLHPNLREEWGTVALLWATSGPIRQLACRSFQTFRVLLPAATASMLASMLGRLSNTVSDPSPDIQSFALEILYTLKAVIEATEKSQQELFCQTFWATIACLSTINENEFVEALAMLDSLLDKIDIGLTETVEMLKIKCPEGWEGESDGIQPLVLRGLKSSITSEASFSILSKLSRIQNASLIDPSEGRLGFLFVGALPWFLHTTDQPVEERDEEVFALAESIASLAAVAGKHDLQKVATSIAKSRFRTKDDLIRQAVGCVKSNYLPTLGPELVVLLLGLVLNAKEWIRKQTMQILKILFQAIDTRSDAFANLGSELLMPLLRLLSTSLSNQALEVLDEPIAINGGPAANQILRMSLQWGNPGTSKFNSNERREQASDAAIFGVPDDSGWAVAHPQDLITRTRINIQAVFKTCELTLDVTPIGSNVNFVVDDDYELDQNQYRSEFDFPEDQRILEEDEREAESASVGDLVNQLHDLSSFFVEEPKSAGAVNSTSMTSHPHTSASEAESGFNQNSIVAKILSRGNNNYDSSTRTKVEAHQLPLGDLGFSSSSLASSSPKKSASSTLVGRDREDGSEEGRKAGWGRRAIFKRKDSFGSSNVKHQG